MFQQRGIRMSKEKLNNLQRTIFELFSKPGNFDNLNISIEVFKTRISFKEGRFNYFILFPRKGIMTLHVNMRKYETVNKFKGFSLNCFNNAKQYLEIDLSLSYDFKELFEQLNTNVKQN